MNKKTKRQAALETVSLLLDDLIENPPPYTVEWEGGFYWTGYESDVDDLMEDFQQGDGGDLIRHTHPDYFRTSRPPKKAGE